MQEEGIDLPPHATVLEIEEIYESCIIHKQISTHKNLLTTVPFSILLSEVLDNGSLGETICDIDLSHGASFINDSQSIKTITYCVLSAYLLPLFCTTMYNTWLIVI